MGIDCYLEYRLCLIIVTIGCFIIFLSELVIHILCLYKWTHVDHVAAIVSEFADN